MKNLVIIIGALFYASVSTGQSTPEELFRTADKAKKSGDAELLSTCITTNDEISPEVSKAVAKMILAAGDYAAFRENNKERIKALSTGPLGAYLFSFAIISRLQDFGTMADSGTYNTEESTYTIKIRGRDVPIQLSKTDGKFTFWPPYMDPSKELLSAVDVYKEFKMAVKKSTLEESQKAVQDLILKYVEPTSLEYKDQSLSGMINGEEWNLNFGKVEQKEAFGKQMFKVELSDAEAPQDCRLILKGNKVTFNLESPGEYDFAQTGQNITLYHGETNKNVMLNDGKLTLTIDKEKNVARGKIAAKKDDKYYVNGTFEVEICGEIE